MIIIINFFLKEKYMSIVSRRIIKPHLGKTDLVMSRVSRFKDLAIEAGAKSRLGKFLGGELNGCLQLTNVYENMESATKSFESYSKNPKMIELMQEREADPAAEVIGPEIYLNVYGDVSPEHNVILLREYEVDRKSLPKAIEILSDVDEIVKKEDSKLLALRPIISDKMNSLYVIYYYSSLSSLGEIIDRVGMSESFQKLVGEASNHGTLVSSNIAVNI